MSEPGINEESCNFPRHVAIIMDGNGRWAQKRGLPRIHGHQEGASSVRAVVRQARSAGLQALTLYAFSQQNWARPQQEVLALMDLLAQYLNSERQELLDNGIRLQTIGAIETLPQHVKTPLALLVQQSASNNDMILTIALSYDSRKSIAQAATLAIKSDSQKQNISIEDIAEHLPTRHCPPVDLLIRTGGEQRISNFLLWEIAYAELYFTGTAWPDFREDHLMDAVNDYQSRQRRYGLTAQQTTNNTFQKHREAVE